MALIFLFLLPVSLVGCAKEASFDVTYSIKEDDPTDDKIRIVVVVTNTGGSLNYIGSITDYFSDASLVSKNGHKYTSYEKPITPISTKCKMKKGETATCEYEFDPILESGTYSLSFWFMSKEIELPNVLTISP